MIEAKTYPYPDGSRCRYGHQNDGDDICTRCGADLNLAEDEDAKPQPEPIATSPYLNKPCLSERERKAVDALRLYVRQQPGPQYRGPWVHPDEITKAAMDALALYDKEPTKPDPYESAARAAGWEYCAEHCGFWYDATVYGSWKSALSDPDSLTYSTAEMLCRTEEIEPCTP